MIKNKEELKNYLINEKKIYMPTSKISIIKCMLMGSYKYQIWKYIKLLRKTEYWFYIRNNNIFNKSIYSWFQYRKNKLGIKLGMDIDGFTFKEGLCIYHSQGIVINGNSRIGKNCILHGANVIGNMGENTNAPVIGDNVRLGIGAKVLGEIYIADDVQIGAGAVVIESCYDKGALLVGVPARIKVRNDKR